MPYIRRDTNGNIVGIYLAKQPVKAEEFLAKEHIDVITFQNRAKTPSQPTGFEIMEAMGDITKTAELKDRYLGGK